MTWKNNPRRTPEECESHYVNQHTRLALASIDAGSGLRRYVQNRVTACTWHNFNSPQPELGQADFDRYIELYFDDASAMERSFAETDMSAIFADHENFMDTEIAGSLRVYQIEETVVVDTSAN
jgi:EthD domain